MRLGNLMFGAALALLGTVAVVAQELTPAPPGFVGTSYRGVTLGQNREQVEAALNRIDRRCATDGDLALAMGKSGDRPSTVGGSPWTPCWIVANSAVLSEADLAPVFSNRFRGAVSGQSIPYNAVVFVEGLASGMLLDASFFNAEGMDAYAFASAITQAYVPDGMNATDRGWRGVSANEEIVTVGTAMRANFVAVVVATDHNTPAFD